MSARSILAKLLAAILYLATLVLGILDIYFIQDIAMSIYVRFSTQAYLAYTIRYAIVFVLAIAFLALVILTGEYHLKNVDKPSSWKLFTQTLAVEALFPILAFFMT